MLQTSSLHYSYPQGPSFAFPDLHVGLQEVLLVLGRSGSGKTTLLHLLAGLMSPVGGSVTVNGTVLSTLSGSGMDAFRGQHIGLVFQQPLFIRSVNVMENLQLARTLAGLPADAHRANQLLSELGLDEKATQMPQSLSIGERQRVSIARALMTSPGLLLADEPTSALDDANCLRVAHLLQEAASRHGAALVIVTHDRRLKDRFTNAVEL
ncbi:MAG: ATP-binding cassette domain-containing protein [Flavobacteriales bacterium]|nr:ATP-binding cassette domain-containing protein [Flavobacteriales bacterium]